MSGPMLGGKKPLMKQPWVLKLLARTTPFSSEEAGWAAGGRITGPQALQRLKHCPHLEVIVVGNVPFEGAKKLYRLVRRGVDPFEHLQKAARELAGNDALYRDKEN